MIQLDEEEKKKREQEAAAQRIAEEHQQYVHMQAETPRDITKPHPVDPAITYTPPVVNGKPQHDFPLDENGLSPYSGLPPVYYNGVLISSQLGNSWDGIVVINSNILQEPLETDPGSFVVPNALIGGVSQNFADFVGNFGIPVPGGMVMSNDEHTDRMNAVIDKMPKRTPEEIEAHFYRVAYEQITGIHKEEAAKRNAAAGIITPDAAEQQPIRELMNMARAVTNAGEQVDAPDIDATEQAAGNHAALPKVSAPQLIGV